MIALTESLNPALLTTTALILSLVLILVLVLGSWSLISLFLQARRNAAIDKLVSPHIGPSSPTADGVTEDIETEEVLVRRVQQVNGTFRERQLVVAVISLLGVLAAIVLHFAIRAAAWVLGL